MFGSIFIKMSNSKSKSLITCLILDIFLTDSKFWVSRKLDEDCTKKTNTGNKNKNFGEHRVKLFQALQMVKR